MIGITLTAEAGLAEIGTLKTGAGGADIFGGGGGGGGGGPAMMGVTGLAAITVSIGVLGESPITATGDFDNCFFMNLFSFSSLLNLFSSLSKT